MSLYRKILVAYDGTGASDVALQQGADLARSGKAALYVLAVVVTAGGLLLDPAMVPDNLLLTERKYLLDAMENAVKNLGEPGAGAITCIRDGQASTEIAAYAREIEADLVVLGRGDNGFFATWFEGDTDKQLLRHLPCSLLIAVSRGATS